MQRTHGENPRTHHETPTKHPVNGWRSPTKLVTNIPPGVGADSSCPYPNITKYAYSHNHIRISTLLNTHFPSPLRVCFRIRGHDKSAPTAADGLQQRCERIAKMLRTPKNFATKHTAKRLILTTYTQKKLLKPLGKKGFRRYFKTKTAYRLRLFFIASIFS